MNEVIISGRLTRDPEVKNTSSQQTFCTFGVAVPRNYRDQQGNRPVDFINCVAWRQQAGFVAHYFKKGDAIVLRGELQSRSFDNSQGQRVTLHEVIINQVDFPITPKEKKTENVSIDEVEAEAPSIAPDLPTDSDEDFNIDDLPFAL